MQNVTELTTQHIVRLLIAAQQIVAQECNKHCDHVIECDECIYGNMNEIVAKVQKLPNTIEHFYKSPVGGPQPQDDTEDILRFYSYQNIIDKARSVKHDH